MRRGYDPGCCRSRLAGRGLFERRRHFSDLVVTFEEAPSCPSRGGSRSAERRGLDPGPRRSPTAACVTALDGFYRSAALCVSPYNKRGACLPSVLLEETLL